MHFAFNISLVQDGDSALALAVSRGFEIVRELLKNKDIATNRGHIEERGHIEIVKVLLKREDINVNLADDVIRGYKLIMQL